MLGPPPLGVFNFDGRISILHSEHAVNPALSVALTRAVKKRCPGFSGLWKTVA